MDRSLKRWEAALLFGVLCALVLGVWLDREQTQLSNRIVRLHVIANSDRTRDQAMKLALRDQVLERAEDLYPEGATRSQALEILSAHLPELAQAGQEVVEEWGGEQTVTASLERFWFPTK